MIERDTSNRSVTAIHVATPRSQSILSAGIAAALRSTPGIHLVAQPPVGWEPYGPRPQADVLLVEDAAALSPKDVLLASEEVSAGVGTQPPRRQPAGVVLVMRDPRIERIVAYLQLGVRAFVCHDAPLDDLVGAVHSTARNQVFLPHGIAVRIIDGILPHLPFFTPGTASPLERLTAREREVFSHMTAGRSNAEIAEACCLSQKTVKFHVSNILRKLGVKNRLQAVAHAHQALESAA
ncbi:helix-turn-helix transcriptional regulator [Streptomyces cinerochromogenes]|uniref:helix-turn-helix transcriptional regulator n=1 Tax=Streptomyces cinerochromogenes TaxID=66422 RepID=UPI0033BDA05C